MDGDVGVGDVLLLTEAPLDVAEEVVRVRQVPRFLWARTEGNSISLFSSLSLLQSTVSYMPIPFSSEAVTVRADNG